MALDPVSTIVDVGFKVFDRLFPDPAQAAAAKMELFKMQQSGELQTATGQMEINKVEAASASLFVSGWRPAVGWVCVAGCGWNWIGLPVALFVADLIGRKVAVHPADVSEMIPLLTGLLGLGGLRTFEKLSGVAAK